MFVRPDWKDGKAYQGIDRASLARIAWEFLRRNPQYQAAWAEYAQQVRALVSKDAEAAAYAEYLLAPNPTRAMADALGDNEKHAELHNRLFYGLGFVAVVPGAPHIRKSLSRQCGQKWGLDRMPHPAQEYSMMNFGFLRVGNSVCSPTSHGLKILEDEVGAHASLSESRWLILQIDLTLPIEVIESAVLWNIRGEREFRASRGNIDVVKSRALTKARYAEYLRILDGDAAEFSVSEIGECVAPRANNAAPDRPRDKRFRAALNEAKRLQADGYRVLPLLQRTPTERKKK